MTNFVLEKDHSMIETRRLKNVVTFFETFFCYFSNPEGMSLSTSLKTLIT